MRLTTAWPVPVPQSQTRSRRGAISAEEARTILRATPATVTTGLPPIVTALRALERSSWARDALGHEFLGVYLKVKQAEYRQFMGEVGEQDWRWYLTQA